MAGSITQYRLRHGEAVAIGVAVDVAYSHLKYGLPLGVAKQALTALQDLHLPIWDAALSADVIFDGLEEFRQHLGGQLTITLIEEVGQAIDVHNIDEPAMRDAMAFVKQFASPATGVVTE